MSADIVELGFNWLDTICPLHFVKWQCHAWLWFWLACVRFRYGLGWLGTSRFCLYIYIKIDNHSWWFHLDWIGQCRPCRLEPIGTPYVFGLWRFQVGHFGRYQIEAIWKETDHISQATGSMRIHCCTWLRHLLRIDAKVQNKNIRTGFHLESFNAKRV